MKKYTKTEVIDILNTLPMEGFDTAIELGEGFELLFSIAFDLGVKVVEARMERGVLQ